MSTRRSSNKMKLEEVISANRETLANIYSFVNDFDYDSSPDSYGLPKRVRHLIDQPIDNQVTYIDLLMFLRGYLNKKDITYIEIGVSVLKTFYQASNFLKDSSLYAFDINKINPSIEKEFHLLTAWQSPEQVKEYEHGSNKITYFQGDVFNEEDFNNFKNCIASKANIVFSDAHHTGEGLKSEYESFIKDILDDEFILYYDDLEDEQMRNVFLGICNEIKSKNAGVTTALLEVNGWLGQHERPHLNGIITSLDLTNIVSDNHVNVELRPFESHIKL